MMIIQEESIAIIELIKSLKDGRSSLQDINDCECKAHD